MKSVAIALALCLLPLAACGTTDPIHAEKTVLDEKALFAAEAAFFGANQAASAAVGNGLLVQGSPRAVQIADALEKAHQGLVLCRRAYGIGDAKSYGATLIQIQAGVGEAWSLISKEQQ